MGVLFGDGTGNFIATVVSVFLLTRLAAPARLLSGLKVYRVLPTDQDDKDKAAAARGGKRDRKVAKASARQQIQVEGAEQVVRFSLPDASIEGAQHYPDFSLVVALGLALACNWGVAATPLTSFKAANYKWPLWVCGVTPLATAWAALQVHVLSSAVAWRDRALLVGLCTATVLGAFASLRLLPVHALDVDVPAAAQELGDALSSVSQYFSRSATGTPVSAPALQLALSAAAGMLAGLLAPGSVRLAKCLALALSPPPATRHHLTTPAASRAVLRMAAALPLLGAMLWVRPMTQDLLSWPDSTFQLCRASIALLLGAWQLAALRPLVQAHLNLGLVEWWTHKHAVTTPAAGARVGELIRLKVDLVGMLVCKVALELLAPAAVWAACGSLLLYAELMEQRLIVGGPRMPTQLVRAAAGFVLWWTCSCWFAFTAVVLAMHRKGLLTV